MLEFASLPETSLDVFAFLSRTDIDACEFISKRWRHLVRKHSLTLPNRTRFERFRPKRWCPLLPIAAALALVFVACLKPLAFVASACHALFVEATVASLTRIRSVLPAFVASAVIALVSLGCCMLITVVGAANLLVSLVFSVVTVMFIVVYIGCAMAFAMLCGLFVLVELALILVDCARAPFTFTRQLIAVLPFDYVTSLRRTFDDVKYAFTEH